MSTPPPQEYRRNVLASARETAEAAARVLLELARERPGATVALSGGSTPKLMYEFLANASDADAGALRKLVYLFGDERSVPNDHQDSNVRLAREGFLDPLGIPAGRIIAPDGSAPDLTLEADRLTGLLERYCPDRTEEGVPRIDLVYLGMGGDGHTASLFPGTEALHSPVAGFVANDVPQLATRRLTLTFPILRAARALCVLVTGSGKGPVLREIFGNPGRAPVYPVENLPRESTTWLLDREAEDPAGESPAN